MFTTVPQPVYAEQFVNVATVLASVTTLSITTDYTTTPPVVSAVVASPTQSYTMQAGDWMVTGPNIEGVYSDALFQATFLAAGASTFTVYATPEGPDPMTVDITVRANASLSVTLDFGDGSSPQVVPVTAAAPGLINHGYSGEGTYTITGTSGASKVALAYTAIAGIAGYGTGPMSPSQLMLPGDPVPMSSETDLGIPAGTDLYGETINERIMDPVPNEPLAMSMMVTSVSEASGSYTPQEVAEIEAGLDQGGQASGGM